MIPDWCRSSPLPDCLSTEPLRHPYYPVCTCPVMHNQEFILSMGMIVTLVIASACASSPQQPPPTPLTVPLPAATPQTRSPVQSTVFTLKVDSLAPGSALPDAFTCIGIMRSPEVSWDGIPPGAKSLVLIMDDPDAPAGTYTHWIVYNIPPEPGMLSTGQPDVTVLPDGARQGNSSAGFRGTTLPVPQSAQSTTTCSICTPLIWNYRSGWTAGPPLTMP